MLQIILAVIGLAIVSTMGYVILEQLSIQNLMQNQRENTRRLDIAGDGLKGVLGRLPGVESLVAPIPGTSGSVAWSVLPNGVGAVNSTVAGVPFLYCPVATLSAEELASVSSVPGSVQMPGSNYAIQKSGSYVVSSALTVDAAVKSTFNPIAFIIAPGTKSASPPDCSAIKVVNNMAVVAGGIVRVVSMPAGAGSMSTGADASAEFWVSGSGTGNGQTSAAPSSIDSALNHFAKYSPDTMTIHVVGTVYPSNTMWAKFAAASGDSGAKLRIMGNGTGVLDVSAGGNWDVPSSTFLENVTIKGPKVIANRGDSVFAIGTVNFIPYSTPAITLEVMPGGRFMASDSIVSFANQGMVAIKSQGLVDIRRSTLRSGSGQLSSFLWMGSAGELNLVSAQIGSTSDRPINSSIISDGSMLIASDSNSTSYGTASTGGCWAWNGTDIAFKWSNMGAGSRSAVKPETDYVAPAVDAPAADIQLYQAGVNERNRARRINASNIYCG